MKAQDIINKIEKKRKSWEREQENLSFSDSIEVSGLPEEKPAMRIRNHVYSSKEALEIANWIIDMFEEDDAEPKRP